MSEENKKAFDRLPFGGAPKIPRAIRKSYRDYSDAGVTEDIERAENTEEQPKRLFFDRLRSENE